MLLVFKVVSILPGYGKCKATLFPRRTIIHLISSEILVSTQGSIISYSAISLRRAGPLVNITRTQIHAGGSCLFDTAVQLLQLVFTTCSPDERTVRRLRVIVI